MLKEHNPRKIRKLGKKIKNMDPGLWNNNSHYIVERGNYLKFSQNEDLKGYLLGTKRKVIAKASPHDGKWGCWIVFRRRKN